MRRALLIPLPSWWDRGGEAPADDLRDFPRELLRQLEALRAAEERVAAALETVVGRLDRLAPATPPPFAAPGGESAGAEAKRRRFRGAAGAATGEPVVAGTRPEPPPATPSPATDRLIEVWDQLRQEVGRFTAAGLRRLLDNTDLDVDVREEPQHCGLALTVWTRDQAQAFLLPDFSKPATALQPWFDVHGRPARTAVFDRLISPARLGRNGELLAKGAIE